MFKKSTLLIVLTLSSQAVFAADLINSVDSGASDVPPAVKSGYADVESDFSKVHSDLTPFYVGAQVGGATWSNSALSSTYEMGSTYGAYAGYDINKFIAIEAGYNQFAKGDMAAALSGHVFDLDGVGTYYLNSAKTFGLLGRVGLNYAPSGIMGSTGSSNIGFDVGAGLRYNVLANLDLRLQYEHMDIRSFNGSDLSEDLFTLGAAYHF